MRHRHAKHDFAPIGAVAGEPRQREREVKLLGRTAFSQLSYFIYVVFSVGKRSKFI